MYNSSVKNWEDRLSDNQYNFSGVSGAGISPIPSPPLLPCLLAVVIHCSVPKNGIIPINQPDPESLPSCCLLLIYLNVVICTNLHILDFFLAFFSLHALDKAIERRLQPLLF